MARRKIIVLGAGLAGLSAAWHLQKKGINCQVFEKEPEVGGLCRSKNIGGFTFDYDGHLLHFRHLYTFGLVKSLLAGNLAKHQRSAWVYSDNSYTRYPFQANLHGLSSSIIKECLLGLIEAGKNNSLKKKGNLTFLDWIYLVFGKGIARHFMIPYNTKFWTLPPQELTCAWLSGFIPVPSLVQAIEGAIEESKRQFGYNSRFWYPKKGGINRLPLALASRIKNIHTNSEVTEINLRKKQIKTASGDKKSFDYLVSAIPLPEMASIVKGLPKQVYPFFKKLRWNSIFNLNLGLRKKDNSGRHWIYFPGKEFCFFRAGFFHNFSSSLVPVNKAALYIEASYSKTKPINKDDIVSRIKKDLEKAGIINKNEVCAEDINDIKYGYPIYDKNYNSARKAILEAFSKNNIISCGRYGSWRYMSMEDALLDGKNIADFYNEYSK